jgi:hypothetical protein
MYFIILILEQKYEGHGQKRIQHTTKLRIPFISAEKFEVKNHFADLGVRWG